MYYIQLNNIYFCNNIVFAYKYYQESLSENDFQGVLIKLVVFFIVQYDWCSLETNATTFHEISTMMAEAHKA